ncbi:MAG: hypothetical protein ACRDV9_12965 [Acidimicrobiia bacterium]
MITLRKHNRLAVYLDIFQARAAFQALEREGVHRKSMSVIGRNIHAAKVEIEVDDLYLPQHVDMVKVRFNGAWRGAIVGITAAMVVWGMVVNGANDSLFRSGVLAALLGLVFGAGGGFIFAACIRLDVNREFRTAARWVEEGMVVVGVHGKSLEEIERARDVLWASDPLRIDRVDRTGRLVDIEYIANVRRF